MSSFFGFAKRNYQALVSPPAVPKAEKPLKFGILGAANIAPMALIKPAISHPDVLIQCVAARDRSKAVAYAKKHGIPEVKASYQDILDDPTIDCVYVPLPNGLHMEWTVRALRAGKHVLLEKPSVSNLAEAEKLFLSPLVRSPDAPVLLEAFHYRFQPSWQLFLSLLDRPNIEYVRAVASVPLKFPDTDIRFQYDLAGGSMMDIGTYGMSAVRQVCGSEPEACESADVQTFPAPKDKVDHTFSLKWRMPGGIVAETEGGLRASLLNFEVGSVTVRHKPTRVEDSSLPEGQEKFRARTAKILNFMISGIYHNITITDEFTVREKKSGSEGKIIKKWTTKETKKAYTFAEAGFEGVGETYWLSYRYQLEQFVNRVRGRQTSSWIEPDDSVAQARMLDMAYEKAGLGPRPSCGFESGL